MCGESGDWFKQWVKVQNDCREDITVWSKAGTIGGSWMPWKLTGQRQVIQPGDMKCLWTTYTDQAQIYLMVSRAGYYWNSPENDGYRTVDHGNVIRVRPADFIHRGLADEGMSTGKKIAVGVAGVAVVGAAVGTGAVFAVPIAAAATSASASVAAAASAVGGSTVAGTAATAVSGAAVGAIALAKSTFGGDRRLSGQRV